MRTKNIIEAAVAIIVCEAAGIAGSFFTAPSIPTWYADLIKGPLNPPSWIFAPVWTTLYALMGIAAYLVWKQGMHRRDVQIALVLFGVQLVLNMLWSYIFFGLRAPGLACVEVVLLWITIAATLWAFAKISKPAAWLLVPYIAWVSFAAYLNYTLWILNS